MIKNSHFDDNDVYKEHDNDIFNINFDVYMNFSTFIYRKDNKNIDIFTKDDIESKSKFFLRNDNDKNSTVNENNARWYNYERHENIKNDDKIRNAMKRQKNDNNKMNNIDWEVERFYNDIRNRSFDEWSRSINSVQ